MLPAYLLPEKIASEDGQGVHVALDQPHVPHLQLTLGITRILERESLDVHVCASDDGEHWKRIAAFPRKSFCGTYTLDVDLSRHHDVRYLRTEWKMHRWSQQAAKPVFSFYVWAEHLHLKALQAAS
jgi:hypothetical protein